MKPIRIIMVDDHMLIRQGLNALLKDEVDIKIIGEAGDGHQAVQLTRELQPDVVIMDAQLPGGLSGLQATRIITSSFPQVKVLALTMHDDSEYVFGMLRAGASGYMLKQGAVEDLAAAIRTVHRGQSALHPAIARIVVEQVNRQELLDRPENALTDREREILHHMAAGQTSKEIGDLLSLSAKTIDNYRAHILEKLGARNKVEAITIALQRGLVEVPTPS
ncbi:MAG TPA: response regulator transcription factor [Chloroflexota bacterium]|nr:response regulator transcription factor [Chloroflexota bacterium]